MCGCEVRQLCGRSIRATCSKGISQIFFARWPLPRSTNQQSIMKTVLNRTLFLKPLWAACLALLGWGLAAMPAFCAQPGGGGETTIVEQPTKPGDPTGVRVGMSRHGAVVTQDHLTLRVTTDLGSIRVVALEPGAAAEVGYTVRVETDAKSPLAEQLLDRYALTTKVTASGVEINAALPAQATRAAAKGAQFWVQMEIAVPNGYSVDVKTDIGDIETQDIGGTATLVTQGGNIRTGRIGMNLVHEVSAGRATARLETDGGHIQVSDVAGDLTAVTAGGHITAGKVSGDASLHSGGGHIRAEQIGGRADLRTDGGNITVGRAGGLVTVRTGGGQIDFGEVRGSVSAQTGGGGIRVMYVSGPLEVESSAGSICLTRVAGAVKAATAGGTITAWINPDAPSSGGTVRLAGASQLTSGKGDIVVFLPRNLAADIDATVESGGGNRIAADPALDLKVDGANSGTGPVHAVGMLNGGGAPLKLRTSAGTIRLQFLDSEVALRESLIREQQARLNERGIQMAVKSLQDAMASLPREAGSAAEEKGDWLDSWMDWMQIAILGGVRENADEFQRHLTLRPSPVYPEVARRAGVQGTVRLEVRATKDGHVEVVKVVEGSPTLADAAIAAVQQWRVNPAWMTAKKAEVLSTVTINFKLQ
jgi:TonB family protein